MKLMPFEVRLNFARSCRAMFDLENRLFPYKRLKVHSGHFANESDDSFRLFLDRIPDRVCSLSWIGLDSLDLLRQALDNNPLLNSLDLLYLSVGSPFSPLNHLRLKTPLNNLVYLKIGEYSCCFYD